MFMIKITTVKHTNIICISGINGLNTHRLIHLTLRGVFIIGEEILKHDYSSESER